MSADIELTADEIEAAAEAAYIAQELMVRGDGKYAPWANQDWSQRRWRASIQAAIDAVNKVRTDGDPEGTIRRHADGRIALRVKSPYAGSPYAAGTDYSRLSWHYRGDGAWRDTVTDECYAATEIAKWPVIYTPEVTA